MIRRLHLSTERVAEIAYHYCQGGSPDDAELAIRYSRQAALKAGRQLAYEEAAHHLRNVIDALALKMTLWGDWCMRAPHVSFMDAVQW